jgi:plasmid stability protein
MAKRMTVIFEDEELYTALKVEAARKGRHAKDIVAEAVREWLESREDQELRRGLEETRREWQEQGGVAAGEFFRDMKGGPAR